ncbi:hypothetical protein INH39_25430 [Massilia violaceinigra]|uniref:Uncharacterized protein n=1 Tax=Massilia violaceinigra TaxID=2045208 RepID=A0ABY4A257_9BURK|nr:hypothetical protein [Massilia violaceinigra]UOD28753.1 hypothetical protein INH39_25430 [Massilia violaceinigra]
MPKFSSVQKCEIDAEGNLVFRLAEASGKFYDLTFDLEFIPSMLILLNQNFVKSTETRSTTAIKDFVEAHAPQHLEVATLPDGRSALVVTTLSQMKVPLVVTAEMHAQLSAALAMLGPIVAAVPPPRPEQH